MVSFLWRMESRSYLVSRVCFSDHWRRNPEKKVISLHHRCCSQEGSGAGLRESLQSNSTLSNNNFFPTGWNAKRHVKKAKRGHLTPNLVPSTPPRLILEMNRSQGASSQRRPRGAASVPPTASLWRICSLSSKTWHCLRKHCVFLCPDLGQTRKRATLPELSAWFCFCIHFNIHMRL